MDFFSTDPFSYVDSYYADLLDEIDPDWSDYESDDDSEFGEPCEDIQAVIEAGKSVFGSQSTFIGMLRSNIESETPEFALIADQFVDKNNIRLKDITEDPRLVVSSAEHIYDNVKVQKELNETSSLFDYQQNINHSVDILNSLCQHVVKHDFKSSELDFNNSTNRKIALNYLDLNQPEVLVDFSEKLLGQAFFHFKEFTKQKFPGKELRSIYKDSNPLVNILCRFNQTKTKLTLEEVKKFRFVYIPSAGGKTTFLDKLPFNERKKYRDIDDIIHDHFELFQQALKINLKLGNNYIMSRFFKFLIGYDVHLNIKNNRLDYIYLLNHPNQVPSFLKFISNEIIIIPKHLRWGDKFFSENFFNLLAVKHKFTTFCDYHEYKYVLDSYFKDRNSFIKERMFFDLVLYQTNPNVFG